MKLGIVGSEAAKFTPYTQEAARRIIRSLIRKTEATLVISGHSPLGGIDWWAIEEAEAAGVPTREYPAGVHSWASVKGVDGFKARNLKIARNSDMVVCITLKELPPEYHGMEFPDGCYHCGTPPGDHIKSGGCWTVKQALRLGQRGGVLVIDEDRVRPSQAPTGTESHRSEK